MRPAVGILAVATILLACGAAFLWFRSTPRGRIPKPYLITQLVVVVALGAVLVTTLFIGMD